MPRRARKRPPPRPTSRTGPHPPRSRPARRRKSPLRPVEATSGSPRRTGEGGAEPKTVSRSAPPASRPSRRRPGAMNRGRLRRPGAAKARSPPNETGSFGVPLASAAATYPIGVVTLDEVRRFALTLPRTTEGLVAGRVKFYVGRIVYLAFSRDETVMGFAFPKDERDWLVGGAPEKFIKPSAFDLRYHWVLVRLSPIEEAEMRELVLDAWRMRGPTRDGRTYDLIRA